MNNLGKYGEYRVMASLFENGVEAYQAIRVNQEDYDITVILNPTKILRIQVKSTLLNNKSKNNSIAKIDDHRDFDFLVVVVIHTDATPHFYILTKAEAIDAKNGNKLLSISKKNGDGYIVRNEIGKHENCWNKIVTPDCAPN